VGERWLAINHLQQAEASTTGNSTCLSAVLPVQRSRKYAGKDSGMACPGTTIKAVWQPCKLWLCLGYRTGNQIRLEPVSSCDAACRQAGHTWSGSAAVQGSLTHRELQARPLPGDNGSRKCSVQICTLHASLQAAPGPTSAAGVTVRSHCAMMVVSMEPRLMLALHDDQQLL